MLASPAKKILLKKKKYLSNQNTTEGNTTSLQANMEHLYTNTVHNMEEVQSENRLRNLFLW